MLVLVPRFMVWIWKVRRYTNLIKKKLLVWDGIKSSIFLLLYSSISIYTIRAGFREGVPGEPHEISTFTIDCKKVHRRECSFVNLNTNLLLTFSNWYEHIQPRIQSCIRVYTRMPQVANVWVKSIHTVNDGCKKKNKKTLMYPPNFWFETRRRLRFSIIFYLRRKSFRIT